MRKPPVQLKKTPQPSDLSRKTLNETRAEQRRREDTELVQIFGSASKAYKARIRAANGNAKTKGSATCGRVRKRGP